jgi:hypothetical protein
MRAAVTRNIAPPTAPPTIAPSDIDDEDEREALAAGSRRRIRLVAVATNAAIVAVVAN